MKLSILVPKAHLRSGLNNLDVLAIERRIRNIENTGSVTRPRTLDIGGIVLDVRSHVVVVTVGAVDEGIGPERAVNATIAGVLGVGKIVSDRQLTELFEIRDDNELTAWMTTYLAVPSEATEAWREAYWPLFGLIATKTEDCARDRDWKNGEEE